MRKVLVGVVVVGVGIALIPLLSRVGRMTREHCEQMARHCHDLMSKGQRNETVPAGPTPDEVDNSERSDQAVRVGDAGVDPMASTV